MKTKTPCADCADREVGCHGKCGRYQAYRAEIEARKPTIYANCDVGDYTRRVKLKIALHKQPLLHRGCTKDD